MRDKKIDNLIDEVRDLNKKIEELVEYLKQRAIPPKKEGKINLIGILKNGDNEYYIIRRQKSSFNRAIREQESNGYVKIKDFREVPNAMYLCLNILEYFKEKKWITTCRNTFKLTGEITNNEMIQIMEEVFDRRLFN